MQTEEIKGAIDSLTSTVQARLQAFTDENAEMKSRIEELESLNATAGGEAKHLSQHRDLKHIGEFMKSGERGRLPEGEHKTLSTATPSSNAMIPEIIADDITAFAKDSSALMNIVRVSNTRSTNYSRILRVSPPGTGWVAETGTRSPTTDSDFRRRVPTCGELYAVTKVTNDMLSDNVLNLAQFLLDDVGRQFARDLDVAILSGNGSNRPTGLLNAGPVATADFASPLRSAEALEVIAAPSPDSLAEHLFDAFFTLQPGYRANARWIMNSQTLNAIRQLKASTSGVFLWQPNLSSDVDAPGGLLLGKPVTIVETMADLGTSPLGYPIAVGDFELGYELIRVGSPTLIRDPYTSLGHTNFYVAQRFGGITMVNDAVKVLIR